MIFITGPLYSGKRAFAAQLLHCTEQQLGQYAVWDVQQLAADCAGRPAIAIVNKSDLPQQFDPAAIAASFAEVVTLAAGRGEGAQALGEAVRRVLGVANLDPSAPCLVSQRQYAAACEGRAALEEAENALAGGFGLDAVSVCVDDALSALCRLTGEDASEAVVEEVFSTFCVGK